MCLKGVFGYPHLSSHCARQKPLCPTQARMQSLLREEENELPLEVQIMVIYGGTNYRICGCIRASSLTLDVYVCISLSRTHSIRRSRCHSHKVTECPHSLWCRCKRKPVYSSTKTAMRLSTHATARDAQILSPIAMTRT